MSDEQRLVKCDFGVRSIPWPLAGGPLTAGLIAGFLTVASCSPAGGDSIVMGVFVGFCVMVLAFLVTAVPPLRLAWGTRVAVDQGGLRIVRFGQASYWPMRTLSEGRVAREIAYGGLALTVMDRTGRPIVKAPLFGRSPRMQAISVAEAIDAGVARGSRELDGPLARLRRNGRMVEDWLRELSEEAERLTARGSGFRGQALDTDALVEVVEDVRFRADDRAAAAYLLLATGSPELAARVLEPLNAATPPIMLAMARAATGDVDETVRALDADVWDYLDREDRGALSAVTSQSISPKPSPKPPSSLSSSSS